MHVSERRVSATDKCIVAASLKKNARRWPSHKATGQRLQAAQFSILKLCHCSPPSNHHQTDASCPPRTLHRRMLTPQHVHVHDCRLEVRASSGHLQVSPCRAYPFASMNAFLWANRPRLAILMLFRHFSIVNLCCLLRQPLRHHQCSIFIANRWLSLANIVHISLTLICLHHTLQLWVGPFLSLSLNGSDSLRSSTSRPVMAIADVLFLPWSSWARLSFVRDIVARTGV